MARRGKPPERQPSRASPSATEAGSAVKITASQSTEIFSGPIPPPEILEAYERVVKGSANRILTMAEEQSKHRKKLEEIVVLGGSRNQAAGMIFAFVLSLVIVGSGAFLIYHDKSLEGFGLILSDLLGLIGVFVYGKSTQLKELKANRESLGGEARSSRRE